MAFFQRLLIMMIAVSVAVFLSCEPKKIERGTQFKRNFLHKVFEERASELSESERKTVVKTLIEAQKMYGIDALLLVSIIEEESKYNPQARSRKGAKGLMQIHPITGRHIAEKIGIQWQGSDDLYNPEVNIQIGAKYLADLKDLYATWNLVLAVYNVGPGKFKELQASDEGPPWTYSYRVLRRFRQLRKKYQAYHLSSLEH